MIPHVIVLEPGLVIYKIYNGYWFLGRPTLEDLRQDLRAVTEKCRPDWDITTPEMKAAWQQGRKELFYPYGKTYAQTLVNRIELTVFTRILSSRISVARLNNQRAIGSLRNNINVLLTH
jgi:hypothetical protein